MKRILKFLLFISVLFLTTGCIYNDSGVSQNIYANSDKYIVGSTEYTKSVEVIKCNYYSGKVTIVEDINSESVKLIEENDLEDKYKVHSFLDNGTLHIEFFESGASGSVLLTQKQLTIIYPSITDLNVYVTSGNIESESLSARKIDIGSTSGSINISSVDASTTEIGTVSGNINIKNITSYEFEAGSTSGSIKLEIKDVEELEVDTISGKVDIDVTALRKADIETTSGNININLNGAGATFDTTVTSGAFITDIPYTNSFNKKVIGDGSIYFDIETISGNIKVK